MRQSDEDPFTGFVRAHGATLFGTACWLTGDYQRAEDLLETTLVRVYQRWPRVAAMDRTMGWGRAGYLRYRVGPPTVASSRSLPSRVKSSRPSATSRMTRGSTSSPGTAAIWCCSTGGRSSPD